MTRLTTHRPNGPALEDTRLPWYNNYVTKNKISFRSILEDRLKPIKLVDQKDNCGGYELVFETEEEMTLFLLKWS